MVSQNTDLDKHFKKDSTARTVAEKLLTGKAYTRQELVEGTGVSVTTVNRVVDELTKAGVKIVRDVDGRHARFRVVEVNRPQIPWPGINDEVRIVGAWLHGDQAVVEFECGSFRYRGTPAALAKMPSLGLRGAVRGVAVSDDELAEVFIRTGDESEPLRIEAVRPTE